MSTYKKIVFTDAQAVFHFKSFDVQLLLDAVRKEIAYLNDRNADLCPAERSDRERLVVLYNELSEGHSAIQSGASIE